MKLLVIGFIMLCFLVSCDANDKEPELVNMEDFIPKSSREEYVDSELVEAPTDTLSPLGKHIIATFPEAILTVDNEQVTFFPDRLSFVERDEVNMLLDDQKIQLIVWKYEDSLQTLNAYYNWLDCFGEHCQSIRIGDEIRLKGNNTLATWVGNKHLIILISDKRINYTIWSTFIDQNYKQEGWNFHFIKQRGKVLNWIIAATEN